MIMNNDNIPLKTLKKGKKLRARALAEATRLPVREGAGSGGDACEADLTVRATRVITEGR